MGSKNTQEENKKRKSDVGDRMQSFPVASAAITNPSGGLYQMHHMVSCSYT